MAQARGELDQTEDSMDSVDSSSRALKGSFLAAAAGATALAVGLRSVVQAGAPIENTFSRIEVLSGATTDEMNSMESAASEMGAEMPLTMSEISDSFYELSRAGFEAEESLAAVEGTANLAVAGALSMEEASAITAQAVNAFGYEADIAAGISDNLASVASTTAADVQGLGDALRYVSTQANIAGLEASDVANAVGVLSSSGMEASMAGTSLNAAISDLIDPTDDATEAMRSLGIEQDDMFDDDGDMRSMAELAGMFADEMDHLTSQEQSELLNEMFDQRSARAMGALISNAEELEDTELESSLSQAAGAIERLDGVADDALDQREAQLGFEMETGSTEDILEQFADETESTEQLEMMLGAGLAIDPRAAQVLAEEIEQADGNFEELAEDMDDTVTSADLVDAQIENVQGQITYITGSLQSLAYTAFTGAAPALSLLLDVGIGLVDALGNVPGLVRAAGAALAVATVAAAGLTAALGAAIVQTQIMRFQQGRAIQSTYGYAAAQNMSAGATRAAAAAKWLMTASLADVRNALAASRAASLGAAGSKLTLAGAATTASGAMTAAATAARGLLVSLGPIGWAVLAVTAAWLAFESGLLDFIGLGGVASDTVALLSGSLGWLGDGFGAVASGVSTTVDGLTLLTSILVRLLALPIVLPIVAFAEGLRMAAGAAGTLATGVGMILSPVDTLSSGISHLRDNVDATHAAMLMIPGMGLASWLLSLTGRADSVREAFDQAIEPFRRMHEWMERIIDLVPSLPSGEDIPLVGRFLEDDAEESGAATAEGFAEGASDDAGIVERGTSTIASAASSFLPNSDAEQGPLSRLSEQGAALSETFGESVEDNEDRATGPISSVAQGIMGTVSPMMPISPPSLGSAGVGANQPPTDGVAGGGTQASSGSGPVTIEVNRSDTYNIDAGDGGLSESEIESMFDEFTEQRGGVMTEDDFTAFFRKWSEGK